MENFEQIVEREKKPLLKDSLVFIGFVLITNIIISIMDIYAEKIPYISTLLTLFLVVVFCSFILMKYFSKYLYSFNGDSLNFYRLIGKRKFHILTIDKNDLIYIEPYTADQKSEKYKYEFIFQENEDEVYRGEFKGDNNERTSFLFSPNKKIRKKVNTILKNKGLSL